MGRQVGDLEAVAVPTPVDRARGRADDRWFGAFGSRIGYQLRRVDVMAMDRLSALLDTIGLTPGRATALAFIEQRSGCDQSALARALGINRASAMAIINALAAIGAVERRPGRDRRSHALALTDAGVALLRRAEAVTARHDEMIFGPLAPDERATLAALLRKLRAVHAPESRTTAEGTVT